MPNIMYKSCCYLYLLLLLLILLLLLLWTVGAVRSVIGCKELVLVTTLGYQLRSAEFLRKAKICIACVQTFPPSDIFLREGDVSTQAKICRVTVFPCRCLPS